MGVREAKFVRTIVQRQIKLALHRRQQRPQRTRKSSHYPQANKGEVKVRLEPVSPAQPQRAQSGEGALTRAHNLLSRRIVYSIYYNSTLVLPSRGERGGAVEAVVVVEVDGGREQETLYY